MEWDFDFAGFFFGLVAWIFDALLSLLPEGPAQAIANLNEMMGPLVRYLAYLGGIDYMFTAVTSAYVIRFLIRRLPVIG